MELTAILDGVYHWAQGAVSTWGYLGLGLAMFLENLFPPIPSEVILPLAGSLTLQGRFTLIGITLVGALGSTLGALLFYGLGYWLGEEPVRRFIDRNRRWLSFSAADFDNTKLWLKRYGKPVIFFGRMVPLVRSLISIPAGLATMNLAQFTLYTALGTALWSLLLAWIGRILGENWPLVRIWIGRYEHLVVATLGIGVIIFIFWRHLCRKRMIE